MRLIETGGAIVAEPVTLTRRLYLEALAVADINCADFCFLREPITAGCTLSDGADHVTVLYWVGEGAFVLALVYAPAPNVGIFQPA
ncbi:MAG: hypothetical protein AAFY84_15435 [Pseudomonadota bacterium]